MKVSILDCPNGYVCRIMQSQEFSIPLTAQLIPAQVIPMIELTLQTKVSSYICIYDGIKLTRITWMMMCMINILLL